MIFVFVPLCQGPAAGKQIRAKLSFSMNRNRKQQEKRNARKRRTFNNYLCRVVYPCHASQKRPSILRSMCKGPFRWNKNYYAILARARSIDFRVGVVLELQASFQKQLQQTSKRSLLPINLPSLAHPLNSIQRQTRLQGRRRESRDRLLAPTRRLNSICR